MNSRRLFVAFLILGTFGSLATPKNAVLNVSNVTIVSIDDHSLVVSRSIKGKVEQIRFILNAKTIRQGVLSVGSQVTVHYTTQNHQNTATSIQSRAPVVQAPDK